MRPIPVIVMLGMIVTPVTPQALAEGSNLAVCSQPDPKECLDGGTDFSFFFFPLFPFFNARWRAVRSTASVLEFLRTLNTKNV